MAEIQTGFFTHEIQLRRLDHLGDPLKAIGEAVDFEMFRPLLNRLLGVRAAGPGRPPWDRVLMSRIHEQRLAGKELSESQKQSNRIKSKVRARIEHRFGRMRTTLKGLAIRSIWCGAGRRSACSTCSTT